MKTQLLDGGQLVVPEQLLRQLGLETGTEIVLDVLDGALRMRTMEQVIKDVQALVRRHVPEDVSLADELIADRRMEALCEEGG